MDRQASRPPTLYSAGGGAVRDVYDDSRVFPHAHAMGLMHAEACGHGRLDGTGERTNSHPSLFYCLLL